MSDSWTSKLFFGNSASSDLKSYVDQIQEENNEFMALEVKFNHLLFVNMYMHFD
jgi:hypothetical protein